MRIRVRNGGSFSNYCPHPVGTYLHCTFNPNSEWSGTTWVRQGQGNYLLAAGSTYVSGRLYGSNTHLLTVAEMPAHTHELRYVSGVGDSGYVPFSASSVIATSSTAVAATGGGKAHNNMPQSIAVPLWVRTK